MMAVTASQLIATIICERPRWVWIGVVALAFSCLAVLLSRISLDSDVLNMLPGNFNTVEGLKVYNRDFEQTRELTFALQCQPEDVERLDEFAGQFAAALRKQPWTVRVLTGSPMETPEGIHDLQTIALPLLLNLEPGAFAAAIDVLRPARIQERLHHLRQQIEAGSPRPQFELEFDPLGVIGPALRPFAETSAIQEEQPLTSPDRTMRLFLVVTNQPSISAFDCQRLMRQVNGFRTHALDGWTGAPLKLFITGRSAYVAEVSLSMRYDIVATLIGSILLVGIIFFVGFRRWLPLFGMGFSLLLSCLVALAAGLLIFRRLNMVTVGFCAILVGLGVDFAILTFGRYQQARGDGESHRQAIATAVAKLGRAVFFGALTTAVGFVALVLSGSIGFIELGVLIAIGILFAGFFMCTILFLFVREEQGTLGHDWIFETIKKYVRWSVQRPGTILTISIVSLGLLTLFGFSPRPRLPFDAGARSLEPKNSRAGIALAAIMNNMPTRWEPVLGIVRGRDQQQLHDSWRKIATHWADLQRSGQIKGFSTPAALVLSPEWLRQNREQLKGLDLDSARQALQQTIVAEGFSLDSFSSGFQLLDELKTAAGSSAVMPDWHQRLPKTSGWWFLIDRYFASNPLLTCGFVTTNAPITSHAQYQKLSELLPVSDVPITFSGWSYTLANLLPWAKHQLLIISALMALFDALLLAVLYRDWRLWLIQECTLVFGLGAMLASMKLLNVPLNLLNVLAFRLVLAIGVDYGIYVLLVWQKARQLEHDVAGVVKPVLLAGLTAVSGFGSLAIARNPSLSGLGITCALGIFWTLVATIFFTLPAAAAAEPKTWREDTHEHSSELIADE
jgi:predicted RND superfamily exporter protein